MRCRWRASDSNPRYRCWPVQRFSKRIVLTALTHTQGLIVGLDASKSDSGALIRQLLCSALCSTLGLSISIGSLVYRTRIVSCFRVGTCQVGNFQRVRKSLYKGKPRPGRHRHPSPRDCYAASEYGTPIKSCRRRSICARPLPSTAQHISFACCGRNAPEFSGSNPEIVLIVPDQIARAYELIENPAKPWPVFVAV